MNYLFRHALYLPTQSSSVARHIDYLHYTVIGAAFAVAFLTFLIVGYFLIRYREGSHRARPAPKMPVWLEVMFAGGTLTIFIVWWIIGFAQYRDLRSIPENAIRVHVVGKQWMWQFVYPTGASSEDELRVPVGQPVELIMTSRDVIHSFYVPAFRLKQDVIPGRTSYLPFTATEPGEFAILCAEYCGAGHSRMRGRVIAMEPADYERWMAEHPAEQLAKLGEHLAVQYGCLRCHTVDGTPHLGPTWKGLYNRTETLNDGRRIVADDAYLTESMMDPTVKIVRGFQPLMPSYLGILNGGDAAAIVEYIRSLGEAR